MRECRLGGTGKTSSRECRKTLSTRPTGIPDFRLCVSSTAEMMARGAASRADRSVQRIIMHKRWCLERTAPRTARPATVFLLEFHLLPRSLSPLAKVSRPIVLFNQMLWQQAANSWQRITYFGHHQRQEARLAAAQSGDEGEQGVEVFLRAGLEFAGFQGDARHNVDEGAGYVEDFFDL